MNGLKITNDANGDQYIILVDKIRSRFNKLYTWPVIPRPASLASGLESITAGENQSSILNFEFSG